MATGVRRILDNAAHRALATRHASALTSERASWQTSLTALTPQDLPASGTTTPPAKQ